MNSPLRLSCAWLSLSLAAAAAADWPQWLGPGQSSVWNEDGVLRSFPPEGLTVSWRAPVGWGYAGPAVAAGKVYLMDYAKNAGTVNNNPGARVQLFGQERVLCLDAATGKTIWTHEYDRPYSLSYPGGPRATPAVAAGKVYALGAEGNLWCLDAATGRTIWNKDFRADYGARSPIWGHSAHPCIHGDTVYCLVGGEGSLVAAFDKDTGAERWRSRSAPEPGYCPPSVIRHGGADQLLIWNPETLESLNPANGDLYWSAPLKPAYNLPCAMPRKFGDKLFVSGIGNLSAVVQLGAEKPAGQIIWKAGPKTALNSVNVTPFIEGGYVYGCDAESSALTCARLSDGKQMWATKAPTIGEDGRGRHGTAFIVKHANGFFLFNELGDLILADLSPQGYREISRFHVLEPTNEVFGRACVWSHPAYANRSVYARNDKELVCVSLAAR